MRPSSESTDFGPARTCRMARFAALAYEGSQELKATRQERSMKPHRRLAVILAGLLPLMAASPLLADDKPTGAMGAMMVEPGAAHAGSIDILSGFARAMPPGAPSGSAYLTIVNHGAQDDRLLAASSAVGTVQLHQMSVDKAMMTMSSLPDGIALPAGSRIELKPGGMHLMFVDVTQPFRQGSMVQVTLTFEKAGSVEIFLPVAPLGATDMPMTMK